MQVDCTVIADHVQDSADGDETLGIAGERKQVTGTCERRTGFPYYFSPAPRACTPLAIFIVHSTRLHRLLLSTRRAERCRRRGFIPCSLLLIPRPCNVAVARAWRRPAHFLSKLRKVLAKLCKTSVALPLKAAGLLYCTVICNGASRRCCARRCFAASVRPVYLHLTCFAWRCACAMLSRTNMRGFGTEDAHLGQPALTLASFLAFTVAPSASASPSGSLVESVEAHTSKDWLRCERTHAAAALCLAETTLLQPGNAFG